MEQFFTIPGCKLFFTSEISTFFVDMAEQQSMSMLQAWQQPKDSQVSRRSSQGGPMASMTVTSLAQRCRGCSACRAASL